MSDDARYSFPHGMLQTQDREGRFVSVPDNRLEGRMQFVDDEGENISCPWLVAVRDQKLQPADMLSDSLMAARVFHCEYELLRKLAPKKIPHAALWTALWPFNVFCLVPRGCPAKRIYNYQTGELTDISFIRERYVFRREPTDKSNLFTFVLLEQFRCFQGEEWEFDTSGNNHLEFGHRSGRSKQQTATYVQASTFWIADAAMTDVRLFVPDGLSDQAQKNLEHDRMDVWFVWSMFLGFVDLLRYANKDITIRKLRNGRRKVVGDIKATLPQSNYEIILRHEAVRYEVEKKVHAMRAQRVRAHPRRHGVREHLRRLSGDRVTIVRSHVRGGIIGPGPHYNARPLAKWKTEHS